MPEPTHAARLTDSCLLLVGDAEPGNGFAVESGRLVSSNLWLAIETENGGPDQALVQDLSTLMRRTLAPLDAEAREQALEFIASTLQVVPEGERYELSEKLFGIREALRERLPLVAATEDEAVRVDRFVAVDDRSFYIEGSTGDAELARLTAVSPEGSRHELLERLYRHGRPDAAEPPGFVCFFQLAAPSLRGDGWVFEFESTRGIAGEVQGPAVLADPLDGRDAILGNPCIAPSPDDELMSVHVVPAISRVQSAIGTEPSVESVTQFGDRPRSPEISIVTPLYLQIEHLESQLAQFADDPDLSGADIIYVLDSPQQSEELLTYAADLFPIYRVPFRVAVLEQNFGFAGANNAGAGLAEARLLLLLNSDILPDAPGWLGTMRAFHDATPGIGALGPKLLYEDDSIQHAGMYYHRLPGSSKWVDGHYFKGMHRSLPAANEARPVPLVSGSCLMIERALYQQLGGLSMAYVQGDYEDAELCLRLWQGGRKNWYLPDAELYHLEGQSYGADIRAPANRYNMWLHNEQWGDQIAQLMANWEHG